MSVKITFEAHSTTFDNEAKLSSGWHDVELSPLGHEQAHDLGVRYKGQHFDCVYCSDLQRSYKTAEIAFAGRGDIQIVRDKRLRECHYGDLTQHPSSEVEKQKLLRIDTPFSNGESYADTSIRMESFLNDLLKKHDGEHVLIIGHRATQYGLGHIIDNIALEQLVNAEFKWQPGWEYQLK